MYKDRAERNAGRHVVPKWKIVAARRLKAMKAEEGPEYVNIGGSNYSMAQPVSDTISFPPEVARILEAYEQDQESLSVTQKKLLEEFRDQSPELYSAAIGCLYYLCSAVKKEANKW